MYQELLDAAFYCRESYAKGLVGGTGGNASVRIGDNFYISPTGYTLGDIQPDDFVRVPLHGEWEEQPDGRRPSKEVTLHRAIYLARPDLRAVLHLHPTNSIALSLMLGPDEEVPAYVAGFVVKIKRLPQVGEFRAGSQELADHTAAALADTDCALMRRHGIVAAAKNIKTAFTRAEEIESNAQLHLLLRGQNALTPEEIEAIRNRPKAR